MWFSCASVSYSTDTGDEFLAVATNEGKIFRVEVQGSGANLSHSVAFVMGLSNAIISMASDPKSKILCLCTGLGATLFLACYDDKEWMPV